MIISRAGRQRRDVVTIAHCAGVVTQTAVIRAAGDVQLLFQGDPVTFQQVRAKINGMTSLDEVVDYITSNFNWDMTSQVVYRFMMAVRRKVQA